MRSRTVREGSVGLLILLGIGCVVGITAWLRGARFGGSYSLAIELADAVGLNVGSSVKYRGVKVGRVDNLVPSLNGVVAKVSISPPSTVIPRDSTVSVTQSGFIGQVELSIQPGADPVQSGLKSAAQSTAAKLSPYRPSCNASVILCDGDRISGGIGTNFDTLIRSTTKLANLLTQKDIIDNANLALKDFSKTARNLNLVSRNTSKTLRDVSQAAGEFTNLSHETRQQLRQLSPLSRSVGQAASQVGVVSNRLGATATDISTAANQVTSLVQVNRHSIVGTLSNIQEASQDLKVAVGNLSPVISRLEKGKLIDNLEALAENGAKASASLNSLTATISDPATVLGLSQTLDSARVTFQNTQKITTDLEQLTGDTKFRQNLIRLINGLSKLVSSSQVLDQQLTAMGNSSTAHLPERLSVDPVFLHSGKIALEPPLVLPKFSAVFSTDLSQSIPVSIDRQPSFTQLSLTQSLKPTP
jgi:phospholipid/cholesterol/gamma-HCH transport system substrate-binding protein